MVVPKVRTDTAKDLGRSPQQDLPGGIAQRILVDRKLLGNAKAGSVMLRLSVVELSILTTASAGLIKTIQRRPSCAEGLVKLHPDN